MKSIAAILTKALHENNLVVGQTEQEKLLQFLSLMQTWNRVFNLTAITDETEMVYLHIIDSLIVKPHLSGSKMLDVGSGAGLPGIPLAILSPDQHWTLLDKNNKKTRFLIQVIAELKLTNVKVVHTRTEDFSTDLCFDTIISRAFATLNVFAQTTQHLLCENGQLVAMKGKYPQDELNDLPQHFKVHNISRLDIKGMKIERHIVIASKNK